VAFNNSLAAGVVVHPAARLHFLFRPHPHHNAITTGQYGAGGQTIGDMMELEPVNSTNIKAIGYDPDTQELQVEFHHGHRVYSYANVQQHQVDALLGAHSMGAHLQQHIAGTTAHPHTRVR
jgi:hypothetical protein